MRKIIEMELDDELIDLFRACQDALDHDEPEQTFQVMIHLLNGAISLTSRDNPSVRLYTRDPAKPSLSQVRCPKCHDEVPVNFQQGDGFRECSVTLF